MRETFLPFSPPAIGEEEIREVIDTLRSGWITTGPKTKRFETEFATYLQAPGALALSSGTAALHTALVASGIGPGDEVITTTMTFCATVHVIEQVGATPVLVDVQPDTLNIDPELVAAAVTPRTRAILPVHYGGHPCEMARLQEIATRHDLVIIEDAAHALPARYKGRLIGSGDNPVAFSFYATKNLTTGEGGMLTGSPDFLERARILSLHGMDRDAWKRYDKGGNWYYDVVAAGFKYNMTDIQASLGIWQLHKLDRFHERRRTIASVYRTSLSKYPHFQIPCELPGVECAWHLYPILLRTESGIRDRDQFFAGMQARNIGTSVHFIPIHMHRYYQKKYRYRNEDYPVATDSYKRLLTLPLYPRLTDNDVQDVLAAIIEIAENCSGA